MMDKFYRLWLSLTRHLPDGYQFYSGPYHGGKAVYTYIPSDGGRLFDGIFRYKSRICYGAMMDKEGYDKVKGEFKDNRKNGRWTFLRKDQFIAKRLETFFNNGAVDGDLRYDVQTRSFSKSKCSLALFFKVRANVVTGDIDGIIDGGAFHGHCDEGGYPDGRWKIEWKTGDSRSKTDYEEWEHGAVKRAYSVNHTNGNRTFIDAYILRLVESILSYDCMELLQIIRRGDSLGTIQINTK